MIQCCPVCNNILEPIGQVYTLDQLLELWKPFVFSDKVIQELRDQSDFTQEYMCQNCNLGIFLPQIIGTPQFYQELQCDKNFGYYPDEKWEFGESVKDIFTGSDQHKCVIEFGCGVGHYLEFMKNFHICAYGLEYNDDAINVARSKGLNVIHIKDITQFLPGIFDASVSFHVLEHVKDPINFIKNMMLYVHPCKICISVPNQDGPIKYMMPCYMNMPPHHATRWRKRTFEVLSDKLGLKIERVAYEPLLLQNHSYYSLYWVNTIKSKFIRNMLGKVLNHFFKILLKLNYRYFWLLQGQSIYVVMGRKK